MQTKLQAGTERPYTWSEFISIIRNIIEEKKVKYHDELDYFDVDWRLSEKPVNVSVWNLCVKSVTSFGGSEGVYSHFYVCVDSDSPLLIATAKTLNEGDEAYVDMHEFAARVCLAVRDYVCDHGDELNWTGYDVGYMEGDERKTYMLGHKYEDALKYAHELKQKGRKVWIRDNAARKYEEV